MDGCCEFAQIMRFTSEWSHTKMLRCDSSNKQFKSRLQGSAKRDSFTVPREQAVRRCLPDKHRAARTRSRGRRSFEECMNTRLPVILNVFGEIGSHS